MYRNQEVVHSGEPGEGVSFVINGIVKVACVDLKDTQDYFLGSGQAPADSADFTWQLSLVTSKHGGVCSNASRYIAAGRRRESCIYNSLRCHAATRYEARNQNFPVQLCPGAEDLLRPCLNWLVGQARAKFCDEQPLRYRRGNKMLSILENSGTMCHKLLTTLCQKPTANLCLLSVCTCRKHSQLPRAESMSACACSNTACTASMALNTFAAHQSMFLIYIAHVADHIMRSSEHKRCSCASICLWQHCLAYCLSCLVQCKGHGLCTIKLYTWQPNKTYGIVACSAW